MNDRFLRVEQAIDRYGSYLMAYLHSLTNHHDAEELFDDLFIHALNRFPEDKILHIGFLRNKAYQLFVDKYRKQQRSPVTAMETLPESGTKLYNEILTEEEEHDLKKRFFKEHPVELTDEQKDVLFLWARYGYTYAEINQKTGIAQSTVADWVKIGRNAIVAYLQKS